MTDNVNANQVTPDKLMQIGVGFWSSKTLLSAVELGLFTELAKGPLDAKQLATKLGVHPRSARDFFDTLVSLGLLDRGPDERYCNAADADLFLDRAKPSYLGGMLEMANDRLYAAWGNLTEALRTGRQQNEAKGVDAKDQLFNTIYSDPKRLRQFLEAMTGLSTSSGKAIAEKFSGWGDYRTFCDVGCAQGAVPVQLALAHPHLSGTGFDLPQVGPIFNEYVARHGLQSRLRFETGDLFKQPLPYADVIIMGHMLHDWGEADKRLMVKKAYDALPRGGALIVYDAIIDDERRSNTFGLLMSLNMLIETHEGFDYTSAQCHAWFKEAGFRDVSTTHLNGPDSMVVGLK